MSNTPNSPYQPRDEPVIQIQVADRDPSQYNLNTQQWQNPYSNSSSSNIPPINAEHIFDIGIFRDTLAPSLAFHSSISLAAWMVGRYTDRVEMKDWVWPSALVGNAWWSAVGRKMVFDGLSVRSIWRVLSWPERVLLTGVTVYGMRMFYRVARRSLTRGEDDRRYASVKKEEGAWNKILLTKYLPEALVQTLIALPFTAPFRHQGGVLRGYHPVAQSLAVGLFSSGFALQTLADSSLQAHKQTGSNDLKTDGVWSIVRHPNYLGDFLIHFSFPFLLYGSDMLAPIELLGPIANYIFTRYQNIYVEQETYQLEDYQKTDMKKFRQLEDYRYQKNAVWPAIGEITNQWTWIVIGAGAAGVALERALNLLH